MKTRILAGNIPRKFSLQVFEAKTGEHCPLSGWWLPGNQKEEEEARFITEGNLMPPSNGLSVSWKLLSR